MKYLLSISLALFVMAISCKKDKPATAPILTTTTATNITATTAQTGGAITSNGGSSITKSGICFALHATPTVADSITTDGSISGTFVSTLNSLMANKTYYVRAYAINATGTGYGNEINFTTAKGLATVTTTSITNNQALTAVSGGNVTNDGGATVTERGVCWSTSAHPTTANSKAMDGSTGTGTFTDTLTNLSLTTYYVRAYAINSYGTAYGNEISFTVSSTGTVADFEGNVYGTVTIGGQTWMTSNLRTVHYQNGDTIVNGFTNTSFDWWGTILHATYIGAFTFPNLDSANNITYGKLYNNYAINDSRGVCPAGWHVPTDAEWTTLEFFEGMTAADTAGRQPSDVSQTAEGSIGNKLMIGGSSGLNLQIETGYVFVTSSGISPGGFGPGGIGTFWSSTIATQSSFPRAQNFLREFNPPGYPANSIYRKASAQQLSSIRCVKN